MKSTFVLTLMFIMGLAVPAFAQDGPPPMPELDGDIVMTGLNAPQGVHVDEDGVLWVIDGGIGGDEEIQTVDPQNFEVITAPYGQTSRILRMVPGEEAEVVMNLPSIVTGMDFIGGADIAFIDGELYASVGTWHIAAGEEVTLPLQSTVIRVVDGEAEVVGDLWAHELANNPDETTNIESHPYHMTVGADGLIYVADAAANTLISVDPATGETETVAVFQPLPGVFPSPWRNNELLTDPVPTGVVVAENGTIYVSLLSGAPFIPGSAKIMQIEDGMVDNMVSDFATGLTMLTDLTMGPDGNLYAVSFGMFTQEGPVFNSGSVIRILEDGTPEVVIEGLPFATSLAFDAEGNGYVVINGMAIPDAGAVVYYEGLTVREGAPLPEMSS